MVLMCEHWKGKVQGKINSENQTKVSAFPFTENPGCFPSINSPVSL